MRYSFSFLPLGGIGEIGANCYILDFGDESFLIDCGLSFCENLYPGIFASIPDLNSVKDLKSKLKGIIITHGHDDHIGALPYFIDKFNVPIYLSPFASELLINKLVELNVKKPESMNILKGKKSEIIIGNRKFVFFKTHHSIPESYGFYALTDEGYIVFTSDFKHFDFKILPQNPFMLFVDATNSEVPEDVTESEVRKTIDRIIKDTEGAFISATFSSNLDRIKSLINLINKNRRKLFVTGKSVLNSLEIAKKLNLVKELNVTPWERINKIPRNEIAIITTGTQGEKFSSLKLMSQGVFKGFHLQKGDSVVISSRIIPGNERNIYNMINQFLSKDVEVFYAEIAKTHSSGHGTAKELKNLLQNVKANYIVPIHGEMRHLKALKKIAVDLGYDPDNVLILDRQSRLVVKDKSVFFSKVDTVKRLYIDYRDNLIVEEEVVKERKKIAEEGVVHAKISFTPFVTISLHTIGFRIDKLGENMILDEIRKYLSNKSEDTKESELESLKDCIKTVIKKIYKRKPYIILTKE